MPTKVDIAIIGAGPAGLTAGYFLAKAGYRVAIFERGRRPGSKNVYGGRIYLTELEQTIPELVREMPRGRLTKREVILLSCEGTTLTFTLEFDRARDSNIVSLTRVVEWLGQKVEQVGGLLLTNVKIEKLKIAENQVKGVVAHGEEIEADIVIDAEGVNKLVLERSGICTKPPREEYALGVKEVYRIDSKLLNMLFDLDEEEGEVVYAIGDVLDYVPGGAFLYTDRGYVHIGVVLYLKHADKVKLTAPELLERVYKLPEFRKVVKSGERVEYCAHLVQVRPRVVDPVPASRLIVVGDAAGFIVHLGPIVRGVDYAMLSGYCAAQTVIDVMSREKKFDRETLSTYFRRHLGKTSFLKDLELCRRAHVAYEYDRLYSDYVKFLVNVFREYFDVRRDIKSLNTCIVEQGRKFGISMWSLVRDYFKVFKKM